jgi:hypothetical protein
VVARKLKKLMEDMQGKQEASQGKRKTDPVSCTGESAEH